jgi:hypothetical protein
MPLVFYVDPETGEGYSTAATANATTKPMPR